jgi:ADP-heptose:LPS heptosyltransferase
MSDADRPVLIYRLGSLGDSVVALPCFHAIGRAFPGPRIAVTNVPVSSKAAALEVILGPGGFVDGAIDYPVGTRSPRRLWNLRKAIRATGARTLVYLAAPRGRPALLRDLLFFRLCGLTTIIGAPRGEDLQCRETADGLEQECKRLVRTLAALEPIDLDDRANWDLRFTPAERARAAGALAPLQGRAFLGINMGGKDASKDWGDANWSALIGHLARDHGQMGLVAVGAREDFDRSDAVLEGWPGPVANLCGLLSPRESGAALGGAALFIGHDSGPLHLAAAGGAQVLGLFGNFNRPRQWHPYGARNRVIHEMRGTGAITVELVAATAGDMLKR